MGVFKVTLPEQTRFWVNLETEHACLADLVAELQEKGIVIGSALWTRRGDDPGERVVTGRRGFALTVRGASAIEDCTIRFVEED